MKSFNHLFPQIISFENLLIACQKASKGKRERNYVLEFTDKLEENLFELQDELRQFKYTPGKYTTSWIYFPKPRLISAAPFRDRVVHHALINILGPLLEKSFIFDSYANRTGKGTHRAIRRYQSFLRSYPFVLKCDIKKFFPSIDHAILKNLFHRKLKDKPTLWLIDTIIDHSNDQEFICDYFPGDDLFTPLDRRKGLPIGNLTSQFFANFYLDPLDHYIKEVLRCPGYLRYVDDFVLFSHCKENLKIWKQRIRQFSEKFRLNLNERHTQLFPACIAFPFLGQVVSQSRRKLSGANVRRFRRRLRKSVVNPPENLEPGIASWLGHAGQANAAGLVHSLTAEFPLLFRTN